MFIDPRRFPSDGLRPDAGDFERTWSSVDNPGLVEWFLRQADP